MQELAGRHEASGDKLAAAKMLLCASVTDVIHGTGGIGGEATPKRDVLQRAADLLEQLGDQETTQTRSVEITVRGELQMLVVGMILGPAQLFAGRAVLCGWN